MNDIAFERQDGIAIIRFDRADKLNSLTLAMYQDLAAAFDQVRDDDSIGVAILTGSGDRAFCVGADLAESIPALSEGQFEACVVSVGPHELIDHGLFAQRHLRQLLTPLLLCIDIEPRDLTRYQSSPASKSLTTRTSSPKALATRSRNFVDVTNHSEPPRCFWRL